MNDLAMLSELFDISRIFLLAAGILVLWVLEKSIQLLANKLAEYFPSRRFSILQMNTLSRFVIYLGGIIALFVIIINPPKEVVIAMAGSMAVAVGFALKDVAASIVAGVVLIFDNPFKTGDRVNFDGEYGEIVAIGLRSVKLRTLDDNIVTIPNARFIADTVSSANYGALDMMVCNTFHVSLDNDLEMIKSIIRKAIVTSRYSFLRKDIIFTVTEVVMHDKLALKIDAKAYVMDVRYEKAFQTDITSTVNTLFGTLGIARPV